MNVLIIMADEHQARALGCAGHAVVKTPAIDALAATGTRFSQCWTPSPICVPARASFATGRWVHQVGAWDSAQPYAGEPDGWTHAVAATGAEVVSFGKLHHRSAEDDDGFSDRVLPMYVAGGLGWVQGLQRDPLGPYGEAGELAADTGVGETAYTRYDRRIVDAAVAWLGEPARVENRWVAFVSMVAPHYPLSAPEEFSDLYRLDDIPGPEIDAHPIGHPAVAAMAAFFNYHDYFDPELTRRARRAYLGLCSFADHHVGRLMAALDAAGLRDDTLVIYTSDHGEMAGNHGLWCKSFMYEDSVAVPMVVAGPGVPAGAVVDSNVNLVDVAATVAEAMGATVDPGPGRCLVGAAVAGGDPGRPGFSEYHDGGSVTGSFAVRQGEWKLVHHHGYPPQLFNLADDPDELIDLGVDPRVAGHRARLKDTLGGIVDPDRANRAAFDSQRALIDHLGGPEALAGAFRFNHTPVP